MSISPSHHPKKEKKRSDPGKMPKNTIFMLLGKKRRTNKKPKHSLPSSEKENYFPLIVESAFWKVTWAVPHSVSESGVQREPNHLV